MQLYHSHGRLPYPFNITAKQRSFAAFDVDLCDEECAMLFHGKYLRDRIGAEWTIVLNHAKSAGSRKRVPNL